MKSKMWELRNTKSCVIRTWLLNVIRLHYCVSYFPYELCFVPCAGGVAPCQQRFFPSYGIWLPPCYWQVVCLNPVLSTSRMFPQGRRDGYCRGIEPFRCVFHRSFPERQVWHCHRFIDQGIEAVCCKTHNWCPLILGAPRQGTFDLACHNTYAFFEHLRTEVGCYANEEIHFFFP